ncbi:MAG TPA: lytic transglycosylase domain-containing protein [Rhizomicrobium sp.]|nr:lytic transglycosylase domain-containing protein [Rhizomicrobium sp.]
MDLLNAACALFVAAGCAASPTVAPAPATQQRIAQWDGFIDEAARRFDLPRVWIRGVMARESAGFTIWNGKPITSAKGAMGLMQLMPDTWAEMRARLHLGNDPYDPHDNIVAGAAYLRDMADRFGTSAFAAYNAGPGRYAAYLNGRATLPEETRAYLDRLTLPAPAPDTHSARNALFVVNTVSMAVVSRTSSPAVDASHELFVPLSASAP